MPTTESITGPDGLGAASGWKARFFIRLAILIFLVLHFPHTLPA